jgi:hypothetical protein
LLDDQELVRRVDDVPDLLVVDRLDLEAFHEPSFSVPSRYPFGGRLNHGE